jgi:hypothetical protein
LLHPFWTGNVGNPAQCEKAAGNRKAFQLTHSEKSAVVDRRDALFVASLVEAIKTRLTLSPPVPLKYVVLDTVRAAGEVVKLVPGEQSAHAVDGVGAFLAAGLVRVPRNLLVVQHHVFADVVFSLRYRSGVPCLPAFRFPAP